MIPRVFHHIWLGSDLPEQVKHFRETWREHHPAWELRLWREEDLDWLENQALFDRAASYPQKADIARYEIIRKYGGVYLDGDMECLRPIDELLTDDITFFAGRETAVSIAIGILGSTRGHPLLRQVVAALPVSCFMNRHLGVNMQTGPGLLTTVVGQHRWENQQSVRIFPPAFFYPYNWSEPWRRSERFRTAFSAHHWSHSWRGAEGVRATTKDLLPDDWSDLVIKTTSIGHAAIIQSTHAIQSRIAQPSKQRLKQLVRRGMPDTQPGVHGIPWGEDHVLVGTPLGTRLLVPVDDISLAPELAISGVYDQPFIDFLTRSLAPGMTFVDVGANVGLFTIVAAALVGPGGRVFAYECNPVLVECLQKNIQMNWFNDRVVLVPKAAGSDNAPRKFWMSNRLAGLGSTVPDNPLQSKNDDVVEMEVASESLDERLAGAQYVDLVKIDVEGGEPAVLDGARELFAAQRIGMLSLEFREDAMTESAHMQMAHRLTELQELWGATFHVPGQIRAIPLDEVLTTSHFPQLLCRLPNATIQPS